MVDKHIIGNFKGQTDFMAMAFEAATAFQIHMDEVLGNQELLNKIKTGRFDLAILDGMPLVWPQYMVSIYSVMKLVDLLYVKYSLVLKPPLANH